MSFHRLLIAAVIGPELARWKAAGHAPAFWWRDDDARRPTPALDRLLALSARFDASITVAAAVLTWKTKSPVARTAKIVKGDFLISNSF